MMIEVKYIETCLSEYLTDHHNRPGELLLGLPAVGLDEEEAVETLWDDLCSRDDGSLHLPKVTEDQLKKTFAEAVKGVDFRPFDENGLRLTGPEDPDWDLACEEYQPCAWFLLTWPAHRNIEKVTSEMDKAVQHLRKAFVEDLESEYKIGRLMDNAETLLAQLVHTRKKLGKEESDG